MISEEKNESLNLFKETRKLFKYWPAFLLSFFVCLLLSVAYIYIAKPVYQINANVLVKNEEGEQSSPMSSMLKGFSFGNSLGLGKSSVDDELLLLSSYTMVRNSIKRLNIHVLYKSGDFFSKQDFFTNSPISVTSVDNIQEHFNGALKFKIALSDNGASVKVKKNWSTVGEASGNFPLVVSTEGYGDFVIDKTSFFANKGNLKSMKVVFQGYDLATENYMQDLEIVIPEKKANGISLSIGETNIQRGKSLLNTLITIYNETGINDRTSSAGRAVAFYDERIEINRAELETIEKQIEEYKKANNITDLGVEAQIMLDKNGDFKEKLIDSEIQYATVSLIEDFLKDPQNKYALAPFNLGITEKTASEGLQQYNDFLLERARLLKTTSESNPVVQSLNEQVEIMRNNVLETFKSIKSGFDFARRDLTKQQQDFVSRIKMMPTQEREFIALQRQQMIKSELYLFLLQQKEEASMKLANTMDKAKIVDEAYSLTEPVKPNKMLILSLAIVFSLIIVVVYLIGKKIMKD